MKIIPVLCGALLVVLAGCATGQMRRAETPEERCERQAQAAGHFASAQALMSHQSAIAGAAASESAKIEAYHRTLAMCQGRAVVVSPGPVVDPAPRPAPPAIKHRVIVLPSGRHVTCVDHGATVICN